jgi:hypothetical protein
LFQNPPGILKIVPKAGRECTQEKIDHGRFFPVYICNESKGKPEQKSVQLSEIFLEIVSVFKEASKKFLN